MGERVAYEHYTVTGHPDSDGFEISKHFQEIVRREVTQGACCEMQGAASPTWKDRTKTWINILEKILFHVLCMRM